MTFRDVYIGSLSNRANPFDWGGDWTVGNCPAVESPRFPWQPGMKEHPHNYLVAGVRDGRFQGENVDWGATAAKMSKAEIISFIDEVYGSEESESILVPHLYERFGELMAFVNGLSDDGHYALVASEF